MLGDPALLPEFATWERRGGAGVANRGPTRPVFEAHNDRPKFAPHVDPSASPLYHASTVREMLGLLVRIERTATALDPEVTPLPPVTFHDPPDSEPDVRLAYPCPTCGRLEILKHVRSKQTVLGHDQPLNCGVVGFSPPPSQRVGTRPPSGPPRPPAGGPANRVRGPSSK